MTPRFYVRKRDFGRGYVVVDTTTDLELAPTSNFTHRAPVKAICDALNKTSYPASRYFKLTGRILPIAKKKAAV